MKLSLARLLPRMMEKAGVLSPVDSRGGWWPIIREAFTGAWQRNIEWRQEDLLSSPIVYACVTLISNDIGKLRSRLVEKNDEGIWVEVESVSPFWPVLRKPNRYQNHIQFKQWWMMSKLTKGNTYALKERDQRGIVVRLYILDPSRVTPLVTEDGAVYYQVSQDNMAGVEQAGVIVPASEIIHDRMNCLYHPLVGISPLYAAAIAAGVGIEIQRNTAKFYANAAKPGGLLIAPGNITKDNAEAIKVQWQANYTGENAGKVAVLGDGMKFEALSVSAVDSQLIETLRWSDERICSVFHVPAYKVGVGSMPNNSNVEALATEYYTQCLQSPIEEFEACMDEGLGLDGFTKGVDLDIDGLMRMDSKTLTETISSGINAKVLTINNGRKRLNLPGIPGGDTVYLQQQDFPIEEIRKNTLAKADPASAPTPPAADPAEPNDTEEESGEAQERAMESLRESVTLTIKSLFAEAEEKTRSQLDQAKQLQDDVEARDFTLAVVKHFTESVDG